MLRAACCVLLVYVVMYLAKTRCNVVIGVAFSTMDMKEPFLVNRWPGTNEVANKVPTKVCYHVGSKSCISWGFECPEPGNIDRGMNVMVCFKLYLDPAVLRDTFKDNPEYAIYTDENVQMWLTDFLRALHNHMIEHISTKLRLSDWKSNRVEYNFSIPTTWQESKVVDTFRGIVVDAGFKKTERHEVRIELTEAEAMAIYTMNSPKHQRPISTWGENMESGPEPSTKGSRVQEGHALLICDSGGRTTV